MKIYKVFWKNKCFTDIRTTMKLCSLQLRLHYEEKNNTWNVLGDNNEISVGVQYNNRLLGWMS